ncbi:hypothetical protein EVAR_66366_1 [Eumeta japonica]|uniref:Uncharacterized protein n=1 Tax=Eumeta variegata TaxID=151549 RepID=A0A4C1ZKV9_EUMVA|nr:hypothetical protein EVAR_66366_1 [Eumeta japonica]
MFRPSLKGRNFHLVLRLRAPKRMPMRLLKWKRKMPSTKQYNLVPNDEFDTRIPLHPDEAFQYGITFHAKDPISPTQDWMSDIWIHRRRFGSTVFQLLRQPQPATFLLTYFPALPITETIPFFIRYPIRTQEACYALMTPLWLQAFMGGCELLLSGC